MKGMPLGNSGGVSKYGTPCCMVSIDKFGNQSLRGVPNFETHAWATASSYLSPTMPAAPLGFPTQKA